MLGDVKLHGSNVIYDTNSLVKMCSSSAETKGRVIELVQVSQ